MRDGRRRSVVKQQGCCCAAPAPAFNDGEEPDLPDGERYNVRRASLDAFKEARASFTGLKQRNVARVR